MSDTYDQFTFQILDARDLVRKLEILGYTLPHRKGCVTNQDLISKLAEEIQPIVQDYFPTWYPEGGGP